MAKSYKNLGRGRKANIEPRYPRASTKAAIKEQVKDNPRLVRFHFLHSNI